MLNYVAVDGVCGTFMQEPAKLSLTSRILPTINVSHARRWPGVPSVINDDLSAGEMAARFLMKREDHSFACLSEPRPWQFPERAIGFRRALRKAGKTCVSHVLNYPSVPIKDDYTAYFDGLYEEIQEFCGRLILPAAVFCTHDSMASNLIDIALKLGLRVPADLKVLGCDNEQTVQADAALPISSIELSGRRIGWMAGESLTRLLRGKTPPDVIRVPPEHVVERATTGAVAYSGPVRIALNILRREARESLDVRSVANRAGVSRRTLETVFRKEVGHSPYEYLIILRLDRARHLLTQTNLRISEVAEECGFGDLRTLGTYFRRNLGMSPREWRKIYSRETVAPQSSPT